MYKKETVLLLAKQARFREELKPTSVAGLLYITISTEFITFTLLVEIK